MHNKNVAACKHVYSKKQLRGGKFGGLEKLPPQSSYSKGNTGKYNYYVY